MKAKFKIGEEVIFKLQMFESFLFHKATITKVFKNGKVKLEFKTWAGHLNKITVKSSELISIKPTL
jgi:hypothetical protein